MLSKEQTEQICLCELKKHGSAIEYIPKEYITEEMCETAVLSGRFAETVLPYIPEKFFTKKFCKLIMEKFSAALKYIPEKCLDSEICSEFVVHKGSNLQYVPAEFQDHKMRMCAVMQDGYNLRYISEEERSEELCGAAFDNNKSAIRYIPENLITEEMCIEAAKSNEDREYAAVNLSDIPIKMRTAEVCFSVLKSHNRSVTDSVPKELKEEVGGRLSEYWREKDEKQQREWEQLQDICRNPHHIKNLSPEQRRREMLCSIAVEQDGMLLHYVPKDMRSFDMCVKAAANDADSLMFVPEDLKADVINEVKERGCLLKILFGDSEYRDLFLQ